MAGSGTAPLQPPLPTIMNLPFQPVSGSHSSILMSESLLGVSVAAMRQCAGRSTGRAAAPAGMNGPALTATALVMRACGSACLATASQDIAGS